MKAKWKTTLKILLGVIGTLLLLIILTVLFWLGPTVKLIAQNVGEEALGTPLSIDKLTINPRKGIIQLSDFSIANPETFGKSNVVSLASMDISIDMGSIFSPTTIVHKVSMNSPYLIYEQAEASDNVQEIVANIQEFMGYDPDAPPDPKKLRRQQRRAERKKDKDPKVVIIESMELNDVQFLLAHTYDDQLDFGVGIDRMALSMTNGSVRLDNFHVTNPGRLETSNLFSLGQFEVLLEPGTIYSTNITIHAVNIREPHLFVEHNPETDTVGEFLKIAAELMARLPEKTSKSSDTESVSNTPTKPRRDVVLGEVSIEDTQLHLVNIGNPELNMHLGIERMNAGLPKGRFELENFFVSNPKRLASPNLFSLQGISADLDPASLKGSTPNVRYVQVDQPYLFLELNEDANTVSELMKIANGFTERLPGYPLPAPRPTAPPADPAGDRPAAAINSSPPVELHSLLVDDIQVKLLDTTSTNHPADQPRMLAGIGEVSIKLVDGKLQIKGITIPNTPGFQATNLFHLANIDIELNPQTVFTDQMEINRILINSPEINLEQTEQSGNVAELQAQLMPLAPPDVEMTTNQPVVIADSEPAPEPAHISEQPVILHELIMTNLSITTKLHIEHDETQESPERLHRIKKFNPLNKIPFDRINPMADEGTDEEIDPDAPLELIALRHLSVEPLKGLVNAQDLRISNPPGFSNYDMVHMTELRVDINSDSLLTDTLVIEDILVDRPRIVYERKIRSDNIKTLREEILNAVARRTDRLEKEVPEEPTDEQEDGQKLIINHLLVQRGTIKAKLTVVPTPTIPLPTIERSGIGEDKGGASLAEVDETLFNSFYNSVLGAVSGATGFATDALKGAGSLSLSMLGLGEDEESPEQAEPEEEDPP